MKGTVQQVSSASRLNSPMKKPKIVILSLSRIPDDPRVRRQGDAFTRQGWDVTGVGLPGARSKLPEWSLRFAEEGSDLFDTGLSARAMRLLSLLQAQFGKAAACRAYWGRPGITSLYLAASELQGDVWLANDWTALPIAAMLAANQGAMVGYDTHELAVEEFSESARWRLLHRPMVRHLESRYLRSAAVISAVSEGIAVALANQYSLPERPLVVRNVPRFAATSFRATGPSHSHPLSWLALAWPGDRRCHRQRGVMAAAVQTVFAGSRLRCIHHGIAGPDWPGGPDIPRGGSAAGTDD